jgi:hypothetical protein
MWYYVVLAQKYYVVLCNIMKYYVVLCSISTKVLCSIM